MSPLQARMRSNGFMPPFALDQPMEGGCVGVIRWAVACSWAARLRASKRE
jgi:hypothetical protein